MIYFDLSFIYHLEISERLTREFYCFVTPDMADIPHHRVHILVKTRLFIVISLELASSEESTQEHKDIVIHEISANNLYASCQDEPPVNTKTHSGLFTQRKILTDIDICFNSRQNFDQLTKLRFTFTLFESVSFK